MAALKLPVMVCLICSWVRVAVPQHYERLYPVISQGLPQTLYQFLSQPQAREFLPHQLTPNSDASRDALDPTTTKTTTRRKSKSLLSKPELQPITQGSFHPITYRAPTTSSSYSAIGSQESSVPSSARPLQTTLRPLQTTLRPLQTTLHPLQTTLHPLQTTLRPNDIPEHPEKGSPKPELQKGGQSKGGQIKGDQSLDGQYRGDQSIGDQPIGVQFRKEQSIGDQSRGSLGTLFRSEVNQKTKQNFVDHHAAPSRAAAHHQLLFYPNNHDASFQFPGDDEHSFSIVNQDESLGPQNKPELSLQSISKDEDAFQFAINQQKLLGSASKQRASRLPSALQSKKIAKNEKESRSDAERSAVKLHQKRAFGASRKVFFEQPHHQGVFEDPHVEAFPHSLGDTHLHSGGGIIGASHHDLPLVSTHHPHGASLHSGQDYHRPAKYDFRYVVKDEYGGNDFGHQESRSGHDTKGAYYVQLPDGRRQTVSYFVNKGSGFVAKVHYEGKAVHPQPKHNPHAYQSGAVGHAPLHQLETFDHVPQGHNLHSSFPHGGVGETVFSLPSSSKFH